MNCHVKRNNKVYAATQPHEEAMNHQQPVEAYPAEDTYSHALAVTPPTHHSYGCGCQIVDTQPAPWPEYEPSHQHDYMQFNGYLRANIGNLMMVEFSCGGLSGDCSMWEKTGVLTEVGDDYIVLSEQDGCGKTVCDLNAVKFVNIMPKECDCDCCCPKHEHHECHDCHEHHEPAPKAEEPFNCNLYNTNIYNQDQQYRNYIMP